MRRRWMFGGKWILELEETKIKKKDGQNGATSQGERRKTLRKQPSFGLCERDQMVLRFVSRRWRVAHVCKTFVWVMCV